MVKVTSLSTILATLAITGTSAFAPAATKPTVTSLNMKNENNFNKFLTTTLASAILLSSAIAPPEAIAVSTDFGSDIVVSARSGGRAGGRSSASSMRSPRPSQRTTVNNVQRTTVIRQAPAATVIAAPPVIIAPAPFYSPFGGLGFGMMGVGSSIGNEMRDARQEGEIAKSKAELEVVKQREFQMEQRLMQMEQNQMMQNAAMAAPRQ